MPRDKIEEKVARWSGMAGGDLGGDEMDDDFVVPSSVATAAAKTSVPSPVSTKPTFSSTSTSTPKKYDQPRSQFSKPSGGSSSFSSSTPQSSRNNSSYNCSGERQGNSLNGIKMRLPVRIKACARYITLYSASIITPPGRTSVLLAPSSRNSWANVSSNPLATVTKYRGMKAPLRPDVSAPLIVFGYRDFGHSLHKKSVFQIVFLA
jgi:hypothetical protein